MAVRPILQLGNPLLWTVCDEITDFGSPETNSLIEDLDHTLADFRARNGFGRGIASPQIGVTKRAIFVRMHPAGFSGPMINPWIVRESSERIELWDDCFSFPDLMVRLTRARDILVEYHDADGAVKSISATGDFAELLQHEIDHLDGILATDRAIDSQSFMTREEYLRRQKGRRS
ncbi:MAG: peptide deformylase [candidate division Zixibacteria bacterium]|nr:peptide deformylase [candidate division Zixibacteria bacterium]